MDKWRWSQLLKSCLNLFVKPTCPLCQRTADEVVCQYCQRQLGRCQLANPSQFWQGELPVFVWGEYGGALKRAIAAFKYDPHPQLARPLGHWLGSAWLDSPQGELDKLTVIPIPLHREKLKKRGFNQAELLAESFCELTGLPLQRQGLERVKETKALFDLSAKERQAEMKNALILGKGFRHRHPPGEVLLLDDIYTTGTTVKAATETLKRAGIRVCGVVAVATTKKGV